MSESLYSRSELLLGEGSAQRLKSARVTVFGAGGVGSYVLEALARAGVGNITVVDCDRVSPSNINRQLIALQTTVGQDKTSAAAERIALISPEIHVTERNIRVTPENIHTFGIEGADYVVDAVDDVKAKIAVITYCCEKGVKVISSMGTGNKLDPTKFEVGDIYKTSVCPLARVMRRELKKAGVERLKVVYSKEAPVKVPLSPGESRPVTGSVSFVPGAAGLIIAGEVIKDLVK